MMGKKTARLLYRLLLHLRTCLSGAAFTDTPAQTEELCNGRDERDDEDARVRESGRLIVDSFVLLDSPLVPCLTGRLIDYKCVSVNHMRLSLKTDAQETRGRNKQITQKQEIKLKTHGESERLSRSLVSQ